MMAAKLHDEDEIDSPLTVSECASVVTWMSCRSALKGATITFGGLTYGNDEMPPEADPGFGLYLILSHVGQELRRQGDAT